MKKLLAQLDSLLSRVAPFGQAPLLFALRAYFGWQFCQTGWGKLMNFSRTVDFFTSLGLPLPSLNAAAAATTECLGGALLLGGLFSRWASLPLAFTMGVAYLTAEREALQALFSDTDKFFAASPFLFLLTALLVFTFGPGAWSLDALRGRSHSGTHE